MAGDEFKKALVLIFFLIAESSLCFSFSRLLLNGQWMVYNKDMSFVIPGNVPGSMYTALLDSGKIQDPYYRNNDVAYRWIGRDDWTYTRNFTVTADVLQMRSVMLVCEGLDTVSIVYVNDRPVGKSDNMFVRYVFDIKSALKVGLNSITVKFWSAVSTAALLAESYPYWVPPQCPYPGQNGECHVNMIRKEQCSFSWDWGPSFPTQGIWRDIYIQAYNTAIIRDITTETNKMKDGSWTLTVGVFMEVQNVTGYPVGGQIEALVDNTTLRYTHDVMITPEQNNLTFTIKIPPSQGIKLWWPNEYGEQSLYNLNVAFTSKDGAEVSNKKIRFGFRTVELVQDYVSVNKSQGRHFYFRINGIPIFFKGSNWVPADSFPERATKDRVYRYLKSAADVHMNSMRVWGGGVYESEDFYDIADELGIMIWQDFMFGCAMYPTDPAFLNSVRQEVTYQVRRLKHRPSVVAYSGNNENEKALRQDWYLTDVNYTLYYNDYLKLYRDTVYDVVKNEDTSRPFLPSSPTNGILSIQEGWIAQQPWDEHYGDIHDYRYLDPYFDPSVYRIPRFASEYGLQSLSSYETLEKVYNETDMDYWSDMNEHRQHHPFGNIEMMAETIMYIQVPNCPDRKQKFKDLIYATQINQAIGMRTETEHYRRHQNYLNADGRGNTMGALYWMLADIWQAPSWASIEYGGKWKMLHYFAEKFFSPLLISPYDDGDNVNVYIILDAVKVKEIRHPDNTVVFAPDFESPTFADIFGHPNAIGHPSGSGIHASHQALTGTLYIQMFTWQTLKPLLTWAVPFSMNTTSQSVFIRNVNDMMLEAGCPRRLSCFLFFYLGDPYNSTATWHALSAYKDAVGLQKANIQITSIQAGPNTGIFTVTLSTDAIAPFVWLETYGVKGRFSDNGFLMVHSQKNVTFTAWEVVDVPTLRKSMTVKSLMDVYYPVQ
ncbi:hypothetical protein ACJMK2_022560 [Sinanodonta woodiana]|uniref:beta-mannosidase n=1 Tax=Sinanodonta woodiana TaxID=1069815 RepID=A0ABD3TJF5_SINWO